MNRLTETELMPTSPSVRIRTLVRAERRRVPAERDESSDPDPL